MNIISKDNNKRKKFLLGYWFTEKKLIVLEELGILQSLKNSERVELIQIDPNHFEDYAHLDGIFNKANEHACLAMLGIEKFTNELERFESFHRRNPNVRLVDSIENVRVLSNRHSINKLLESLFDDAKGNVFIPNSTLISSHDELEGFDKSGVQFPLICKPEIADSFPGSHDMILVFNNEGLERCLKPCVAQSFINHNGLLYKAYCIKDRYFLTLRPSLPNINIDSENHRASVPFNRREIPKPPNWKTICIELTPSMNVYEELTFETLRDIFTKLQNSTKINLLGVDFIFDSDRKKFGLIDLNVFPSYRGIPNVAQIITKYIEKTLENVKRH